MKIASIIPGNYVHNASQNTYNVTLAVSFKHLINYANINLNLTAENSMGFRGAWITKNNADTTVPPSTINSGNPNFWCRNIHFQLNNLSYDHNYSYQVFNNGSPMVGASSMLEKSKVLEPITLNVPNPHTNNSIRFAFAGDQEVIDLFPNSRVHIPIYDVRKKTEQIYNQIRLNKYNFFVHLSDLIYGEGILPNVYRINSLQEFRSNIGKDFQITVRSKLGSTIVEFLMDDHDFGKNSMSYAETQKNPENYMHSLNAFGEIFPMPYKEPAQRLYHNFKYGDIEIWYLHNRIYSGVDANYRLLGQEQFQWLQQTLHQSTAEVKFIATSLPFATGKKMSEDFRGSEYEWNSVLQLFAQENVNAIFCADSHNYSRTDLVVNNRVIPQFLVGTLGGFPQHLPSTDKANLPHISLPANYSPEVVNHYSSSRVQAYYYPWSSNLYRYDQSTDTMQKEKIGRNRFGFLDANVQTDSSGRKTLVTQFFVAEKHHSFFNKLKQPEFEAVDTAAYALNYNP